MNETKKVVLLGSRGFKSKLGESFAALSLLDVEEGKFLTPSVPAQLLAEGGIEGPSMTEVLEMEVEDDGMRKKVVGFKKTALTYELRLVS